MTDFAPVGLVSESPRILIARKDLPVNNLQEFIAYVKANQARCSSARPASAPARTCRACCSTSRSGVNITHVPYRGAGPVMQDLIGGRIDYMCDTIQTGAAQAKQGTVKGIAVMAPQARADHPGARDHRRAGPGRVSRRPSGTRSSSRKGTPAAIVRKLNKAMSDTVDDPAIRKKLEELGLEIVPPEQRSPEYLAKFLPQEIERWGKVIQAAGITAN